MITFHSLEDRDCQAVFQQARQSLFLPTGFSRLQLRQAAAGHCDNKEITASDSELAAIKSTKCETAVMRTPTRRIREMELPEAGSL